MVESLFFDDVMEPADPVVVGAFLMTLADVLFLFADRKALSGEAPPPSFEEGKAERKQ